MKQSRDILQCLIDELRQEVKSAIDKKFLLGQIVEMENEIQFFERIANANQIILSIEFHIIEAKNQLRKLARKLRGTKLIVGNSSAISSTKVS